MNAMSTAYVSRTPDTC